MRIANVAGRAVLVTADNTGTDIATASAGRFGPSVQALYEQWTDFVAWAADAPTAAPSAVVTFGDGELESPSPAPRQVFAIGLNYAEHADESDMAAPEEPAVFTKFVTSIAGPVTEVVLPAETVDWEVELVLVVGREARNVTTAEAWSHVAGVTVGQDLSERKLQLIGQVPQFSLAKSYPGFSPLGPYLVTTDELADPDDLAIACAVNDETVQKSRTRNLIFSVPVLLQKLSAVTPLLPGDLIFTGTPAGVGAGRKPPRFLAPGDVLVSQIEGVGEITQTFISSQEN